MGETRHPLTILAVTDLPRMAEFYRTAYFADPEGNVLVVSRTIENRATP